MRRFRIAMRTAVVLALLIGASGCGLNRPLARKAEALVAQTRPTETSCARDDRCAIESPYRPLVEQARAASRPDAPAHFVNVLEYGEDSLLLRVHLIRAATRSIDIQTFIWAEDTSGWLMLDELIAAAKRGVHVRVLVDQLFSLDDVEWLSRIASAHANLEFRLYNPTFDEAVTQPLEFAAGLLCCFSTFNQRMHNKLFLVDGEIGIAGGRNVEDRYFDWDQEFDYRDRDVLVLGPQASTEMQASFEQFWSNRRAVPLTRLNDVNQRIVADAGKTEPLAPPANIDWPRVESLRARALDPGYVRAQFVDDALRVGRVEYFSDAPGKPDRSESSAGDEALSEHVASLLTGAQSEIVFETPYLVLSKRARSIFRDLYKRSPRVNVTVSTNSLAATDAFYVYALSHKYKKRYLKRYGFHIYEFKPFPGDAAEFVRDYDELAGSGNAGKYERYGQAPLNKHGVRIGLHAKSLVIDDAVALIGSHNFDPRSDNYNTESGFIIHDREVAARVRSSVLRNTEPQNAWVIARRVRPPLFDGANDAISDFSTALPLFDFWPFRYATSYQLKPGCEAMPPTDPRFHECYEDVGDFPEVDLPMKTIYTRVVTAFGAGLVGIL